MASIETRAEIVQAECFDFGRQPKSFVEFPRDKQTRVTDDLCALALKPNLTFEIDPQALLFACIHRDLRFLLRDTDPHPCLVGPYGPNDHKD